MQIQWICWTYYQQSCGLRLQDCYQNYPLKPKGGAKVPVAVWSVTAEDEAALDRYEGFPAFYYKTEMKLPITGIKSGTVRIRDTFVYIMHEDRRLGIPSDFYIRTCQDGYRNFGFDENILYDAIENSRRNCHEE